jgi:hypothetical protein
MVSFFLLFTYIHDVAKMVLVGRNFADFGNYYFFAQQLRQGKNIYGLSPDDLTTLKNSAALPVHISGKAEYAPLFFWLVSPFTALPFWTSNSLWLLLNHLALLACMVLAALLIRKKIVSPMVTFAAIAILLFASNPLLENTALGQINIPILLALLIIALYNDRDKHPYVPGILLGFLLLLKPQFGLLLLFFVLEKEYALCITALVSYTVFHLLGLIVTSRAIEIAYWHNLFHSIGRVSSVLSPDNFSLKELFTRLFSGVLPAMYVRVCYVTASLAALVTTLYHIKNNRTGEFLLRYASVISLIVLISPLTEEHHLIFTLVPFIALIFYADHAPQDIALLVTTFSLIMVRYSLVTFGYFNTGIFSLFASAKIIGILLLWWLTLRSIRRSGCQAPSPTHNARAA